MRSYNTIVSQYLTFGKYNGERFGQFFCNRYIKNTRIITSTGEDLFYCPDTAECGRTIQRWLRDHHYVNTVPVRVQ